MMAGKPFTDEKFTERFWKKTDQRSACWLWKGVQTHNGYGHFDARLRGQRYYRAHRYSYALHNGDIPARMLVCHTCDNRFCVNPEHLYLGTSDDNNQEMMAKRRHAHGENTYCAKLTEDDVRAIREETGGLTEIGNKYGVDPTHIKRIISGEKWSHVK